MKQIIAIIALGTCINLSAQTVGETDTFAFNHIIDSFYKPGEPGGVALVAQHGKIIYNHPFGMANLELGVKMQPDMIFPIGSMTKQFTATCILQLAEQGKLKI